MISTVFMKKAKIPVTVDIQRVTGILYVLKCHRWDNITAVTDVSMWSKHRFSYVTCPATSTPATSFIHIQRCFSLTSFRKDQDRIPASLPIEQTYSLQHALFVFRTLHEAAYPISKNA